MIIFIIALFVFETKSMNETNTTQFTHNKGEWSNWYGGSGTTTWTLQTIDNNVYVTRICARINSYVNGITAFFSNDESAGPYGSSTGDYQCYALPFGECVTSIKLSVDESVDGPALDHIYSFIESLQFVTSDGHTSPCFGTIGKTKYTVSGQSNECLTRIQIDTYTNVFGRIRFYFSNVSNLSNPNPKTWWYSSTPKMPVKNLLMAAGNFNNTIYLIGGDNYLVDTFHGLMEYDTNTRTFSYNASFFPKQLYGWSQFWIQIDSKVYLTDDQGYLNVFDLAHKQFTPNLHDLVIPDKTAEACLAGEHHYIYYLYLHNLYIFDLFNENPTWVNGPKMQTSRQSFSCIVSANINSKLYAIGGSDTSRNSLSTIEYIYTQNITNNSWFYTNQTLTEGQTDIRSVMHSHFIFVIGGTNGFCNSDYSYCDCSDKVHIIDTITNKVTLSEDRLIYPVQDAAPIIVNDVIYVFGGTNLNDDFGDIDTFQYYILPALSAAPSYAPSNLPSFMPSRVWTNQPTNLPTNQPTTITLPILSNMPSNPTTNAIYQETLSSLSATESMDHINLNPNKQKRINGWIVVLIVFSSLLVICMIIAGIVYRKKWKKKTVENSIFQQLKVELETTQK